MTDYSFNVIIDTSNVQLGQVIRANISSQGIFRVFYNDISGNMYCALSRQSNYKQVILETAENRTKLDVSNNLINNTNNPLYGGTNHPEELKYLDNGSNFYVFKYDGNENDVSNNGPWEYFTDLQLQSYIKQGTSHDPVSGNTIYDSNGYSSILADGNNSQTPARPYYWYEQQAFGVAVTKSFNKGGHHIGAFVPDLFDLYGQTVKDIENKPLNSNYSVLNNLIDPSGVLTQTNMSLDTNPFGKQEIYNKASYVIASKRPKFTWLDENNSARTTGEISTNPLGDTYYKGHFDIFIDISYNSDTSGNVYLVRHNRNAGAEFFDVIYQDLTANGNEGEGVKEVYVDLDLDISKNAIDASFNNIYARPYFAFCSGKYETESSKRKAKVRYGYANYDISGAIGNQVNINEFDIELDEKISTNPTVPGVTHSPSLNYININVDPSSNDWNTTRWHIIVQVRESILSDATTPPIMGYQQQLCWISGIGMEMTTTNPKQVRINSTLTKYMQGSNSENIVNEGKFCSMVVDPSNGYVHIAHYAITLKATNKPGIIYTYMNPSSGNVEDVTTSSDWEHKLIDDDIGDTLPEDISNNHPIDIKISPFDNSVHICYQKFNSDGTTSIGYWSNSKSVTDLSHVDVSVNYLGVYSQGRTLDISEASVELHWDLPMSNCLFSRDYTRYDGSNNVITGLKESKQNIKRYISPRGGRISSITKTHQYNSPLNYKGILCDKIYATCRVKTPATFNTWNYIFLLGEGVGRFWFGLSNGKLICVKAGITDISQFKLLSLTGSNYYYKNSSDISSNTEVGLNPDTNYELEVYYNKTNYYGYFIIKNLDSNGSGEDGKYNFYNLFQEGGYHIYDGRLSIGAGNHDSIVDEWNGTIYKIAIYATDISNIPTFDISRNGEILNDTSGNNYLNYFDNSGNSGLNIEPYVNRYQIVNAKNSLNSGNISGSSYEKPVLLHDIYFLEYIFNQESLTEKNIVGFDTFEGLNEIWAYGHVGDPNYLVPTVWVSLNGGINWDTRETPSTNDVFKWNNLFTCIKTFIDLSGGKWVFVGGENYLIYVSNDYGIANDGTIQPGNRILGSNWKIIGDAPSTNGTGEPNGVHFYRRKTNLIGPFPDRTISFIYPVLINPENSESIFGTSPSNSNDFHLWIGTNNRPLVNGKGEQGGTYDMVLRGNHIDYNNNTLTYKYNTIFNKLKDISDAGLWDFNIKCESLLTISFGGVYNGITKYTNENIRKGLNYGIIGTENFIFITKDGGKTWDKRLQIDRKKDFGRGLLINGYHGRPIKYNFDYSTFYDIYEYQGGSSFPNPLWDTNDASTHCVNNQYDRSFSSDIEVYKCLGHDRQPITTTGSYVSKNQTGYDDTNVNIKVFTGTEPWNGNQNFILANNDSNYDLSFSPIDSNTIKTQTWEPSLKTNSFWNVETLDNNGILIPTKDYTFENNYKVYMDKSKLSDGTTYKQEEWVTINESLNNKKNILYKKNNEYGYWQKIEYSVVDPLFSQETELVQHGWKGFAVVDLSHSIISIADYPNPLTNKGFGFFKLSRVPFVPQFALTYPFAENVFAANIDITYNNEPISNFKRINRLFIEGSILTKIFKRKEGEDFILVNTDAQAGVTRQFITDLDPGGVYDFKIIFINKYGESWESNISDKINIPAPEPFITDLSVTTKLLVNTLKWKNGAEVNSGNIIKTVDSYNISKQSIDISGNITNYPYFGYYHRNLTYRDNSNNSFWNGENIKFFNTQDEFITLTDIDIELKKTYNYTIDVFTKEVNGVKKTNKFIISTYVDNGSADELQMNFSPTDISLNIVWTKNVDISNNLYWDISFTEIRNDLSNDISGNIIIDDPYVGEDGIFKERNVFLPLENNSDNIRILQSDASYNVSITANYISLRYKIKKAYINKHYHLESERSHAIFITNSHLLFGSGNTENGKLGIPHDEENPQKSMVPIYYNEYNSDKSIIVPVIDVALGKRHTLLLLHNGSVLSFGDNGWGALGRSSSIITDNRNLYDYTQNNTQNAVTPTPGLVYSHYTKDTYSPILVNPPQRTNLDNSSFYDGTNAVSIAAGDGISYILLNTGTIVSVGQNMFGERGYYYDNMYPQLGPEPIDENQHYTGNNAIKIDAGDRNFVAIVKKVVQIDDGNGLMIDHTQKIAMGCGYNWYGWMDLWNSNFSAPASYFYYKLTAMGTFGDYAPFSNDGRNVEDISIGYQHVILLTEKGSVMTNGRNLEGQLGRSGVLYPAFLRNITVNNGISYPEGLRDLSYDGTNAIKVYASAVNSAILLNSGTLITFGSNAFGQSGHFYNSSIDHFQVSFTPNPNFLYDNNSKYSSVGNASALWRHLYDHNISGVSSYYPSYINDGDYNFTNVKSVSLGGSGMFVILSDDTFLSFGKYEVTALEQVNYKTNWEKAVGNEDLSGGWIPRRAGSGGNLQPVKILTSETENITFFNKVDKSNIESVNYDTNTDIITINYSEALLPNKAYKYVLDFSHNDIDLSFNIETSINLFSKDGRTFFPGVYTVKVKPIYLVNIQGIENYELEGNFSDNSTITIPEHKIKSLTLKSFDNLNNENIRDVSYVKISWEKITDNYIHTGFSLKSIPLRYELIRKEISLYGLENTKIIDITDISITEYVDTRESIGIPTVPRIYEYELKAMYT